MGVLDSPKEGDLRSFTFHALSPNKGAPREAGLQQFTIEKNTQKVRLLSEVTQSRIKRGDSFV